MPIVARRASRRPGIRDISTRRRGTNCGSNRSPRSTRRAPSIRLRTSGLCRQVRRASSAAALLGIVLAIRDVARPHSTLVSSCVNRTMTTKQKKPTNIIQTKCNKETLRITKKTHSKFVDRAGKTSHNAHTRCLRFCHMCNEFDRIREISLKLLCLRSRSCRTR